MGEDLKRPAVDEALLPKAEQAPERRVLIAAQGRGMEFDETPNYRKLDDLPPQ